MKPPYLPVRIVCIAAVLVGCCLWQTSKVPALLAEPSVRTASGLEQAPTNTQSTEIHLKTPGEVVARAAQCQTPLPASQRRAAYLWLPPGVDNPQATCRHRLSRRPTPVWSTRRVSFHVPQTCFSMPLCRRPQLPQTQAVTLTMPQLQLSPRRSSPAWSSADPC
jgi:hypothetical protein